MEVNWTFIVVYLYWVATGSKEANVFTAVFHLGEDVGVVMEVNAVEDEGHGELGEDKTQLMQKKRFAHLFNKQYDINEIINEGKLKDSHWKWC